MTWIEETLKRLSERDFDLEDYNFELDSKPPDGVIPVTLCGKLGRKHRMKRISSMITYCIYNGCDGHC